MTRWRSGGCSPSRARSSPSRTSATLRFGQRDLEADEQRQAEALLANGAAEIGAPEVERHVVLHASTGEGLAELAERENADVVVFGSEYRTAPGAVVPGTSAQRLLSGGSTAVAIAPAGLRSSASVRVGTVGVIGDDEAATETGRSLAKALGAELADPDHVDVDLLVVGSREGTPEGRVELTASAEYAIETATAPVIAVPRGVPVEFTETVAA